VEFVAVVVSVAEDLVVEAVEVEVVETAVVLGAAVAPETVKRGR
jgi:hypothetical protein